MSFFFSSKGGSKALNPKATRISFPLATQHKASLDDRRRKQFHLQNFEFKIAEKRERNPRQLRL